MKCVRCESENFELEKGRLIPKPMSTCKVCGFVHYPKESNLKKGDEYNVTAKVEKMKKEIPTVIKVNNRRYVYDPKGTKRNEET